MQNSLPFLPLRPADTEGNSPFNVVIAYEDLETGKHGKKTFDLLVEHLSEECSFNNQMWKFDVLSVPKLREMAAKDAADADIIIISTHGKSDLPDDVKAWIEQGLAGKPRAIALVALFDRDDYVNNPARSYLAGMAQRAHIDFFSQPAQRPKEEGAVFDDWEDSNKNLSALVGLAQHDRDASHWGINE